MSAVLAAEPTPGLRAYLCAFETGDGARSWLVVDDDGASVVERRDVRDVVAIAALCEIAEESAAGGDLDELLVAARRVAPDREPRGDRRGRGRGAEPCSGRSASPPHLATPARLDDIGAATRRLEQALDPAAPSPFTAALKGAQGTIDELLREVEAGLSRAPLAVMPDPAGLVCSATLTRWKAVASFPFGGDPEEILRGLREFAETQSESVKEAQREQFATLTLSTAVELTAAALNQIQPTGGVDEQAVALRDAMRVLFPEAVALVSAARQGFMRET